MQRSIAGLDRPSDRTQETLRRFDLEKEYRHDVSSALQHLEKYAQRRAEPELVYALAELSWIEGKRLDRWRKPEAIDRFLDAAAYAHDYLFGTEPELADGRGRSDPRFRLACEIYNAGVERLIRAALTKGQIQLQNGDAIPFKVHGREQSLRIVLQKSPWHQADIHKILLTSDFEVTGLNKDLYQYGLGVPLIAVRETEVKKGERSPAERFYPDEMAFPLTAFLVPNSRLSDPNVDIKEARECTLQLYDPVKTQFKGDGANKINLEIDLTTPLAYMWSHTDLDRYRWTGLLRPEHALERANLILIRPYEPGKIPVVMVHGLASSPLAWIPMLNELLRNPVIQDKYQFLLFMYPTGVPIPIAGASLRESLMQARQLYNPDGSDPEFDRMVLLGHSMGGILSRMMAVSSADKLWRLYSDRTFEDILGPRPVLDELTQVPFLRASAVRELRVVGSSQRPTAAPTSLAASSGPRQLELDFGPRQHPQAALPASQGQPRRLPDSRGSSGGFPPASRRSTPILRPSSRPCSRCSRPLPPPTSGSIRSSARSARPASIRPRTESFPIGAPISTPTMPSVVLSSANALSDPTTAFKKTPKPSARCATSCASTSAPCAPVSASGSSAPGVSRSRQRL